MTLCNTLSLKEGVHLFSRVGVLSEIMLQGMDTCSLKFGVIVCYSGKCCKVVSPCTIKQSD